MIVVRNAFRLKFGKAKEAKALWKDGVGLLKKAGGTNHRLLTDATGPFYTLVLESTYKNLADFEAVMTSAMGGPEFEAWYQKFVPLVDSGSREIFTVVE